MNKRSFQDTHIHIQEIKPSEAREKFVNNVLALGLDRFFTCAIRPSDWPVIRTLADTHKSVLPFFGIHPWFVDLGNEAAFLQLEEYLSSSDAMTGEIGLDRARKNIDYGLQKEVFTRQLILTKKFNKPFVVHCVRAWGDTLKSIQTHAPAVRFLMHSFHGPFEMAQEITKMGGFFSISVKELLRPDPSIREVFESLPEDRILLETDFPYQVQGADPAAYIAILQSGYETAATWRQIPTDNFIRKIYDNGTVFTHGIINR